MISPLLEFFNRLETKVSAKRIASLAFSVRLLMICYSAFHDAVFNVKYTDIDYYVVTDGAKEIWSKPFLEGTPFDRATYRYTPFLAVAFLGNVFAWSYSAKLFLCAADVAAGIYAFRVLKRFIPEPEAKRLVAMFIWLNPVVINVSTRGNMDILVAFLALAAVSSFFEKGYFKAGVLLGIAVHVKIYPIIYAAPFAFAIWHNIMLQRKRGSSSPSLMDLALNRYNALIVLVFNKPLWTAILGTLVGAGLPTLLAYGWLGQRYIDEALLYHIGRVDHRHNLSPYWYPMYLALALQERAQELTTSTTTVGGGGEGALLAEIARHYSSTTVAFIPQLFMLLVVGFALRRNVAQGIAIQTVLFVAFNKVCTVQYFVWFLPFLPFVLGSGDKTKETDAPKETNAGTKTQRGKQRWVIVAVAWFGSLILWMLTAKRLEFDGEDVHLGLWLMSCVFFLAQVSLAVVLCRKARESQRRLP